MMDWEMTQEVADKYARNQFPVNWVCFHQYNQAFIEEIASDVQRDTLWLNNIPPTHLVVLVSFENPKASHHITIQVQSNHYIILELKLTFTHKHNHTACVCGQGNKHCTYTKR